MQRTLLLFVLRYIRSLFFAPILAGVAFMILGIAPFFQDSFDVPANSLLTAHYTEADLFRWAAVFLFVVGILGVVLDKAISKKYEFNFRIIPYLLIAFLTLGYIFLGFLLVTNSDFSALEAVLILTLLYSVVLFGVMMRWLLGKMIKWINQENKNTN